MPQARLTEIAALDYLIAIYSLILIAISYILVSCYDKVPCNCEILCKPIKCLMSTVRVTWNIHTSITDAYATFFLLSYSKLPNTSMNLLIPTTLYYANKLKLDLFCITMAPRNIVIISFMAFWQLQFHHLQHISNNFSPPLSAWCQALCRQFPFGLLSLRLNQRREVVFSSVFNTPYNGHHIIFIHS